MSVKQSPSKRSIQNAKQTGVAKTNEEQKADKSEDKENMPRSALDRDLLPDIKKPVENIVAKNSAHIRVNATDLKSEKVAKPPLSVKARGVTLRKGAAQKNVFNITAEQEVSRTRANLSAASNSTLKWKFRIIETDFDNPAANNNASSQELYFLKNESQNISHNSSNDSRPNKRQRIEIKDEPIERTGYLKCLIKFS